MTPNLPLHAVFTRKHRCHLDIVAEQPGRLLGNDVQHLDRPSVAVDGVQIRVVGEMVAHQAPGGAPGRPMPWKPRPHPRGP